MPINLSGNTISSSDISILSTGFTTKINRNGLCLYLDAGDANSYNGSGNWLDLSGLGNNCAWNSAPTWNSGGYFTFNGSANYGTITNNSTLDFSNGQTVIIVMKPASTTGRRNPWNQAYGGYGTWTHEYDDAGDPINQYFGDSGTDAAPYIGCTSPGTTAGTWHMMGSTRDTQQHAWYKNATIGTVTIHTYGVLAATSANILIGNGYAGYWQGDMAMVLAYRRALQPYEMAENFQAIRNRFSL